MPIPLLPETTTTTDPTATPVSSPSSGVSFPIYNPLTPAPAAVPVERPTAGSLENLLNNPTSPTIWITTTQSSSTVNGVTLEFDYLPESVTFGVTADFEQHPVTFTSARFLQYQESNIEEVSLTVKVVAGCNNCITYFQGKTMGSNYLNWGNLVSSKFERVSLINLAKLLYALPLPANNYSEDLPNPPPTCRLTVARMFTAPGAFTACSITFNGPYDYDGSPTDMDVSLRFLPSEFYNSDIPGPGVTGDISGYNVQSSPTGESQITGGYPYALTFGDTPTTSQLEQEKQAAQEIAKTQAAQKAAAEQAAQEAAAQKKLAEQGTGGTGVRKGPTTGTPTEREISLAFHVPQNQIEYSGMPDDIYKIGGVPIKGEIVRQRVTAWRSQQGLGYSPR